MPRQWMRRSRSTRQISVSLRIAEVEEIYNGRNSKFLLLGILEEIDDIVPYDDARLPAENAGGHTDNE